MNYLKDKTAVITGGSSGIGYATAKMFMDEGARVLITGRNHDQVAKSAKELNVIGIPSDQSDLSQIDKLVEKASVEFGKVDILFMNAGSLAAMPFEKVTVDFYDAFLQANLKGVFFTIQKFLPVLNENASIILMSAGGTRSSQATGTSVFYISKAAMNSLARSLAVELAPRGIRVNAILPAAIETPILSNLGIPEEALPRVKSTLAQAIPLKRMGAASEVASLVAFLASNNASFVSGAEYVIDGGLAVKPLI